jgi:hypothetical protein
MAAPEVTASNDDALTDWPYTFEQVPIEHTFIDDTYQRPLSRFVRRIVDNFDPALVGSLVISEREPNRYAVIDGQTRREALGVLGHTSVPALVYRGLTRQQEASMFARFQSERKNISALERFRAALVAEDPTAQTVAQIADRHGFVIERTNEGNSIHAVRALEIVLARTGPEMLERVLNIGAQAWKFRGGMSNELIRGLAYFLEREPRTDDDKLIRRLSIIDPDVLHTRAAQLRQGRGFGGNSPQYMAEVIRMEYRRRRPRSQDAEREKVAA